MAVYGRVAPSVNASRPPGEWQTVEVTMVANRVTVMLNGQMVHDDVAIDGIDGWRTETANEASPGPIMIQGDHAKIWVRKLVVTPVRAGPSRPGESAGPVFYDSDPMERCVPASGKPSTSRKHDVPR
jgi:hypothetical protein